MNAQAAQMFGFAETSSTGKADRSELKERPAGCSAQTGSVPFTSPSRIQLQPENVRNGLAQLVLTLVELLRELLERQALRRIDAGSLTSAEVERLGTTFLRLAEEIERLKEYFGFTDEDLNLNLGPLGKLR
jgi:hypothetical protein